MLAPAQHLLRAFSLPGLLVEGESKGEGGSSSSYAEHTPIIINHSHNHSVNPLVGVVLSTQ